jgi:ABC-2 type transport system permease protein
VTSAVSTTSTPRARPPTATTGLPYYLRVLRVQGTVDFKARYTDAALGYVWSVVKPLAYFGVLWVVFSHFFASDAQPDDFALFLLIGVLLFMFFTDGVTAMLPSIVDGGATLRRLSFPPVLIPLSAAVAICITFGVNLTALAVFAVIQGVTPSLGWLLLVPLLAELCIFTVGLGLLLCALYVRFRDIGQVWELAAQLLFFACAIFYPVGILPDWAEKAALLNPFVQILQDVRHVVLGGPSSPDDLAATDVFGGEAGRLIPLAIVGLVFGLAVWFFRREGRYFAERL